MNNQQKADEAKENQPLTEKQIAKETLERANSKEYKRGYEDGFKEGVKQNEWVSVNDRLPELNAEGFSENVFAIAEDYDKLLVMCYCTMPEGRVWANCYGEIDGHGEWDDEYIVTHWMPLPKPPSQSQAAQAAQTNKQ